MRWDESKWKPKLSRQELKRRRISKAKDLQKEMIQSDVARKYNVNPSSVCWWNKALKENGYDCRKGRRAKGTYEKCFKKGRKIIKVVVKRVQAYDIDDEVWLIIHIGGV